jgi:hypothetical protein
MAPGVPSRAPAAAVPATAAMGLSQSSSSGSSPGAGPIGVIGQDYDFKGNIYVRIDGKKFKLKFFRGDKQLKYGDMLPLESRRLIQAFMTGLEAQKPFKTPPKSVTFKFKDTKPTVSVINSDGTENTYSEAECTTLELASLKPLIAALKGVTAEVVKCNPDEVTPSAEEAAHAAAGSSTAVDETEDVLPKTITDLVREAHTSPDIPLTKEGMIVYCKGLKARYKAEHAGPPALAIRILDPNETVKPTDLDGVDKLFIPTWKEGEQYIIMVDKGSTQDTDKDGIDVTTGNSIHAFNISGGDSTAVITDTDLNSIGDTLFPTKMKTKVRILKNTTEKIDRFGQPIRHDMPALKEAADHTPTALINTLEHLTTKASIDEAILSSVEDSVTIKKHRAPARETATATATAVRMAIAGVATRIALARTAVTTAKAAAAGDRAAAIAAARAAATAEAAKFTQEIATATTANTAITRFPRDQTLTVENVARTAVTDAITAITDARTSADRIPGNDNAPTGEDATRLAAIETAITDVSAKLAALEAQEDTHRNTIIITEMKKVVEALKNTKISLEAAIALKRAAIAGATEEHLKVAESAAAKVACNAASSISTEKLTAIATAAADRAAVAGADPAARTAGINATVKAVMKDLETVQKANTARLLTAHQRKTLGLIAGITPREKGTDTNKLSTIIIEGEDGKKEVRQARSKYQKAIFYREALKNETITFDTDYLNTIHLDVFESRLPLGLKKKDLVEKLDDVIDKKSIDALLEEGDFLAEDGHPAGVRYTIDDRGEITATAATGTLSSEEIVIRKKELALRMLMCQTLFRLQNKYSTYSESADKDEETDLPFKKSEIALLLPPDPLPDESTSSIDALAKEYREDVSIRPDKKSVTRAAKARALASSRSTVATSALIAYDRVRKNPPHSNEYQDAIKGIFEAVGLTQINPDKDGAALEEAEACLRDINALSTDWFKKEAGRGKPRHDYGRLVGEERTSFVQIPSAANSVKKYKTLSALLETKKMKKSEERYKPSTEEVKSKEIADPRRKKKKKKKKTTRKKRYLAGRFAV